MVVHLSTNPNLPHVPHICHVHTMYIPCVNHTWCHIITLPNHHLSYSPYNYEMCHPSNDATWHSLFPFFSSWRKTLDHHIFVIWCLFEPLQVELEISCWSLCNGIIFINIETIKFWVFLDPPRSKMFSRSNLGHCKSTRLEIVSLLPWFIASSYKHIFFSQ